MEYHAGEKKMNHSTRNWMNPQKDAEKKRQQPQKNIYYIDSIYT